MSLCKLIQKGKLKIVLAAVSDPLTGCVCIVGMETGPGIHKLIQPKHMVKELQLGGHKQAAGGLDAARGPPIEDH